MSPTVDEAVALWMADLRGRTRRRTVDRYCAVVRQAAAHCGWRTVDDITAASAIRYLDDGMGGLVAPRRSPWMPTTRDQVVRVLRLFGQHLRASRAAPENPVDGLRVSRKRGGQGSRAPTLQEVRAIIRAAAVRSRPAAHYYLALFLAGLRGNEARHLRWSDIEDLGGPEPHIVTGEWDKTRPGQTIPICRELMESLLELRFARDRVGVVYPRPPTNRSWHADREAAGVAEVDARGRRLTPHGARKWLKTTLVAAGVPEANSARILRHSGGMSAIYNDPPAGTDYETVARLPRIWLEVAT